MEHMENAQISGTVTIDGVPENQFRRAIEAMLREGRADEAARRLKDELVFLCGEGLPLPARFRFISAQDVSVTGWPRMLERIAELDRPGDPITALSLDICLAPLAAADAEIGRPFYETSYYTDRAWPFSRAARADLVLACGSPAWQGSAEDNDDRLQLSGLEDLHIVIAAIEALCLRGMATIEEQRAFIVGACYLAVLSHQAVRDAAMAEGLPRPMVVIVGSDGTYPAFEAAALVAGEGRAHGTGLEEASAPPNTPPGHHDATEPSAPIPPTEAWHLPPPGIHVTGTQLRHRLVTRESIAELEAETSPSLLNRVFGVLLRKK